MEIDQLPVGKKIILFDGVCNLCDSAVQYVIKRDKNGVFRFAALQSEIGKKIVKHIGINPQKTDSVILYEPGLAYYYKSDAALEISKNLGGFISYSNIFRILPRFISDLVYDVVARNRYRWYGKKEQCMIPTSELKGKFLE